MHGESQSSGRVCTFKLRKKKDPNSHPFYSRATDVSTNKAKPSSFDFIFNHPAQDGICSLGVFFISQPGSLFGCFHARRISDFFLHAP